MFWLSEMGQPAGDALRASSTELYSAFQRVHVDRKMEKNHLSGLTKQPKTIRPTHFRPKYGNEMDKREQVNRSRVPFGVLP
jgi:hypothetical protein